MPSIDVVLHDSRHTGRTDGHKATGQCPDRLELRISQATEDLERRPRARRWRWIVSPPRSVRPVPWSTQLGYTLSGDAMTITPALLRQQFDINVGVALWLTQAVVPHMEQQGGGVIVHTGAEAGLEPSAGLAAYSLSKAAIAHLTRVLDVELGPLQIRVNAVLPRVLATKANRAVRPPELLATALTPESVAESIAFLVSDASAAVRGALLPAYY